MTLLVLLGPNLPLQGEREDVAGGRLSDLEAALREKARALGQTLKVVQSNHEGVLLDTIHAERQAVAGIVINPTSLFGSYPLKEALELVGVPAIAVQLKPPARESVVAEACAMVVEGSRGFEPYLQALETFASGVFTPTGGKREPVDAPVGKTLGRKAGAAGTKAPPARPADATKGKTLGRKAAVDSAPPGARAGKTLGRGTKGAEVPPGYLTRAEVRRKIADRLSGMLSAAELATWARTQYQQLQRGAPAESGHRELLEDILQSLTLSTVAATRLRDEQLVDLMTRLEEG
ncbi:3-dehydroquinate dehydratase [Myxococcaceae bacterium JPH2]|nr:3-dehydroquinate dehydratase [Myxococcaceae bacterium JPH2]